MTGKKMWRGGGVENRTGIAGINCDPIRYPRHIAEYRDRDMGVPRRRARHTLVKNLSRKHLNRTFQRVHTPMVWRPQQGTYTATWIQ